MNSSAKAQCTLSPINRSNFMAAAFCVVPGILSGICGALAGPFWRCYGAAYSRCGRVYLSHLRMR